MREFEVDAGNHGTPLDPIVIAIDHAIVQHFSQHLYSSPHKAIEELVVNGYDAGADLVRVYLPGEFASDAVLVWDDGLSMDEQGMHQLWWIARSPKNAPGARELNGRAVIGKFGIGKLASYALGEKVAHLAHRDGRYLLVEFDFGLLGLPEDGQPQTGEAGPEEEEVLAPLTELSADEALAWISRHFATDQLPEEAKKLFTKDQWTVAVISQLRELKTSLKAGTLRRVLGNSLPDQPTFAMHVNDIEAKQVLPQKTPAKDLSAKDDPLRSQLLSDWENAKGEGRVSGNIEIDATSGLVSIPILGEVRIGLKTFSDSLLHASSAELGRSYGVFVIVRNRLLNEDDYQHLVQDPSFGTLYRAQIVIHADGLDAALLADRERLSTGRAETIALRIIEQSAYRAARQLVDKDQADAALEELSSTLLPTNHRELWHDPITSYLASHDQDQRLPVPNSDGDVLERIATGSNRPTASYSSHDARFQVNTDHPFRSAVDQKIGGGRKARQLRRVLDVLAVAEVLLEGRLLGEGLSKQQAGDILNWRDDLLREIGRRFGEAPEELQARVVEASFSGDKEFEVALRDIFRDMGFDAERKAGPGAEDILAVAPVGTDLHRFTIDAKGSKNRVSNLAAHVGGVAAHRDAVKAEHALIIARDFAGLESSGDMAAVLKECKAAGRVSAVTLETLFEIHDLMHTYMYPLRVVLDMLRNVRTPEGYADDIAALTRPRPAFDYPHFLATVWDRQGTQALGEPVYYQALRQDEPAWKESISDKEMTHQMLMLEWASGGLIVVDSTKLTVTMRQNPDMVLAAVEATLSGNGYVHAGDTSEGFAQFG